MRHYHSAARGEFARSVEFWVTRASETRVFRIDSAVLGIWGSGRISVRRVLQGRGLVPHTPCLFLAAFLPHAHTRPWRPPPAQRVRLPPAPSHPAPAPPGSRSHKTVRHWLRRAVWCTQGHSTSCPPRPPEHTHPLHLPACLSIPPTLVPPTLLPRCTGRDRRRPHDRVTDQKMRPTCFALLALLAVFAAAQNPCALECRRQTCSSLNHSFSCEELSGFGCDCVSRRWVLKPHAHRLAAAPLTRIAAHARTGGLLRRRAGSHRAAATTSARQAATHPQAAGSDRRPPHQRRRRRRPWRTRG